MILETLVENIAKSSQANADGLTTIAENIKGSNGELNFILKNLTENVKISGKGGIEGLVQLATNLKENADNIKNAATANKVSNELIAEKLEAAGEKEVTGLKALKEALEKG